MFLDDLTGVFIILVIGGSSISIIFYLMLLEDAKKYKKFILFDFLFLVLSVFAIYAHFQYTVKELSERFERGEELICHFYKNHMVLIKKADGFRLKNGYIIKDDKDAFGIENCKAL